MLDARVIACWDDHLFGAADLLRMTRTAIVVMTDLGTSYLLKKTLFPDQLGFELQATGYTKLCSGDIQDTCQLFLLLNWLPDLADSEMAAGTRTCQGAFNRDWPRVREKCAPVWKE